MTRSAFRSTKLARFASARNKIAALRGNQSWHSSRHRQSVLRPAATGAALASLSPISGGGRTVTAHGNSYRVSLRQQTEGSLRYSQGFATTDQCCLTPRSSRAPTAWHAGHQALGLRPIVRMLSSAPSRRCHLNSNVRHRQNHPPVYSRSRSSPGSPLKTKTTHTVTPARALRQVF